MMDWSRVVGDIFYRLHEASSEALNDAQKKAGNDALYDYWRGLSDALSIAADVLRAAQEKEEENA